MSLTMAPKRKRLGIRTGTFHTENASAAMGPTHATMAPCRAASTTAAAFPIRTAESMNDAAAGAEVNVTASISHCEMARISSISSSGDSTASMR